jgi:aspartokinase
MALVVQKYGGTSVGTVEKIQNVARRVARTYDEGNDMVVVVSAMAGETNKLVALAEQMCEFPSEREYDVLVAAGEQVSIALLSMAAGRSRSSLITLSRKHVSKRSRTPTFERTCKTAQLLSSPDSRE